ncbi:MAG: hypothetical protein QOF22_89 [Bradyrhizobium sp.]|jgi:hypothetical protein|nr:hypothetical protein [Bradyrhizobium sp.]
MQALLSYPVYAGYPVFSVFVTSSVFAISNAGVYWITRFRG